MNASDLFIGSSGCWRRCHVPSRALIVIVLLLEATVLGSLRADLHWRENFDDRYVDERWYADFGIWEFGLPTSGPTNSLPIPRVAGTILGGDYPEGASSRLIRDESFVVPPSELNPRLRFRHWRAFNSSDSGSAQVKAAGGDWGCSTDIGPGWYLDDVRIITDCLVAPRETETPEGSEVSCRAEGCQAEEVFSLAPGAPEGATIDPVLGVFTWIPTECQGPSTNLITITVVVQEVNEAPVIGAVPRVGLAAGAPTLFNATQYVYDPDCPVQVLTYSLDQGSPANATIDPGSGVLDWVPTPEQAAQNHTLYLRVTDELGASATREVPAGPVIPGPRIVQIRVDGDAVLRWLEAVTAGQELSVQSTSELKNPPPATAWSPVGSP